MISDRIKNRPFLSLFALVSIAALLLFVFSSPLSAQDDLSDPATCMECHAEMERDTTNQRVHNPDGTVKQETHQMFGCTDCHDNITEIPHPEGTQAEVDCLNCHETEPEL